MDRLIDSCLFSNMKNGITEEARSAFTSCVITLHYAPRAMGAMTLWISELCLSFSPHRNISDGKPYLVHHFICVQIFQTNEEERESIGKVINQIFGRQHHPKKEVGYLKNLFRL